MNPLSKAVASFKILRAFWRLAKDPSKLEEVFGIADTLLHADKPMVDQMVADVKRDAQGRLALEARHRLGEVSLSKLRAMPSGTLGRAFSEFLDRYGLDPSALPVRPAEDEGSWLSAHLYETHDLWHVVTGFEADVAGELGLQAFYAAQLSGKLPTALLAIGFLNTFLFAHHDRVRRLDAIARGWELGKRMRPLAGYRWADALARPLAEVKAELGFFSEGAPRLAA